MDQTKKQEQELFIRLSMYEQHIQELQQQLQAVQQTVIELSKMNIELDDLEDSEGREILAQIGRGIYAKARLISKDLIVNIGDKNLVGKSVSETKQIIQKQIQKLDNIKNELEAALEKINTELTKTIMEYNQNR